MAGKQPWDFWGLAEHGNNIPNPENPANQLENFKGDWGDVLSNVNVMLNRSGLTYKELRQLLDMQYVNPTGNVFIFDTADKNAANCDTSLFTIRGLNTDVLNHLQRFIRLWRILGCAMWELDLLLPDVNPDPHIIDKQITDDVLYDISGMQRLRNQFGFDWNVVYSLYHNIDDTIYIDRSADGSPTIQTLYQRLFRNKLVDAVAVFPTSPDQISGTIADKVPGILAALRIKEADLSLILTDLHLATTDPLDWTVLSRIYHITVLAQALGLNVEHFLRLKRLWGQDPFSAPAVTLVFVKLARKVAATEFSVLELDYLLAHQYTQSSGVALDDKAIVAFLKMLREGLQKINDDIRLKTEETPEAYVKSKLGLIPTLVKDTDQVNALAIIADTWQEKIPGRNSFIHAYFDVLHPIQPETNLAPIAPGLSPADHQTAVNKRFAYMQPTLQAFLLQEQKEALIRQNVADFFQLTVPTANELLTLLHLPGAADTLLHTINAPTLLSKQPDGTYTYTLDITNFLDIFKSLRLLHKNALLIGKLNMRVDELSWWLAGTHAANMDWMHPNDFPIDTTTSVPIAQWEHLQDFFGWKSKLPKSDLTAFEFLDKVLDVATSAADTITVLAQLTSWDAGDITALVGAFSWDVKQELRKSASLLRLADCMQALRRLGIHAARAIQVTNAESTSADAESLKQTVKAKYDLPQWLQVIQPLQDDFREQKRLALVSWLVTHPNQAQRQNWSDTNGLYGHFLIDVEMSACMLTSRLKQAAASAQLFAQRCLMNIEEDILAKTDLDSKWKQWQWMKRYRVWEANRKVFLYPENWIEPELRDEKSPFFIDLEHELMQNDINGDTVEQAYLTYLEKLDKVANLEIRAMFNQVISQDEEILHVFGRSRSSQAPEYYYRKRINKRISESVNSGRWLAWEKVDLEINANHLIAGLHNRRLYLLWPQFLEKADPPLTMNVPTVGQSGFSIQQPGRYWEIRLFWSELKKGKWTPKVLSDVFATVYQTDLNGNQPEKIDFRTRLLPYIAVRLFQGFAPAKFAPLSISQFNKIGKQVSTENDIYGTEYIVSPPESQYANNLILHTSSTQYFYYASAEGDGEDDAVAAHENAESIPLLRKITPSSTYAVIDAQAQGFANIGSFFMWDTQRSYFVDYNWHKEYTYVSGTWYSQIISAFRYYIHYHPFVELFIKELNIWGIQGLLNRQIQVDPGSIPGSPPLFNFTDYQPTGNIEKVYPVDNTTKSYPVEDVDFSYTGAYAPYNWELFFHVPFFIANKLSTNQRFEEALQWFHYIFDPTSTDTTVLNPDTPQQKYWITKPFYETTKADYYKQKIENLLLSIARGEAEFTAQVNEWRDNPFNPHLIARMRTVAYQKNVLIKYIQALIAWGDQLFSNDTIETINEATQLYILAASILGPRPKSIPRNVSNPIKTLYQLEQEGIDDFGNVLKQVENLLPTVSSASTMSEDHPELPHLEVLYFCIPNNTNLLTLWDTVADRLFKIRHCMNIQGVVRQLPLFEPPIDPALLVKATAAGLDIAAVLNDMNAPMPLYRFTFMIQRAIELCNEVKMLGSAVLSALEKKDAEGLALLRSSHELTLLDAVRLVRAKQVDEAQATWDSLQESRHIVEERQKYYQGLVKDGWNLEEKLSLGLVGTAMALELAGTIVNLFSSSVSLIPEFDAGVAGFGASPTAKLKFGGKNVADSFSKAADILKGLASIAQMGANMSSSIASFKRRDQEWAFQQSLAEKELPQIDKQITAADIRHQITAQELANHDTQRDNAQKEDDYLHTKFTNQELHDWMINQISTVYFQSYQLAYDIAKRAERCFRYELGLSDSNYIQFGYWDSLKQGLLSGEKLFYDLKRLEITYYEQNRRDYELTKHISLVQLDPIALIKLRQNGECFLEVPETLFDMDYPGQYFRRIKTVGLTIPCIAGPYTTVACTLTLISNHVRKDATVNGKYERDTVNDDPRFRDEIAAIQSIATSSAQSDNGLFELNFRDERYLPFEGAGAISTWHIKLNKDFPQLDFATISDVIIHLNYTAREGGELLRSKVVAEFNKKMNALALAENRSGSFRVFDLKREYPDKWYKFLHPANPADDQQIILENLSDRLPYFTRQFHTKKARRIDVVARMKDAQIYKVMLSPLGDKDADLLSLAPPDDVYQGLYQVSKDLTGIEVDLGTWTIKVKQDGAADFKSLPGDSIEELFLIINYTIA